MEEIRFLRRLPDFGLSKKAKVLRNRLTAMGYRLARARSRTEWSIYKVWLGAEDEFQMQTTSLHGIEAWTVAREEEIFQRADFTARHQSGEKF